MKLRIGLVGTGAVRQLLSLMTTVLILTAVPLSGCRAGREASAMPKNVPKLESSPVSEGPSMTAYKQFSPEWFKAFYDSYRYPDIRQITASPVITGGEEADRRIVAIAEERGYRLRGEGSRDSLVSIDGKWLQPAAASAWQNLKEEALKDGIVLGLISGFRSVERQRTIFLDQLARQSEKVIGRKYTAEEIAAGKADAVIQDILCTYSIPGYSKHHTGYTLDITDAGSGRDFTDFAETGGFRWISDNNYLNARRFGFIPSYPEGVSNQGPIPEAWEYVWVGEPDILID
jgi:D-alanyl-D-alanine carboxypeptidase